MATKKTDTETTNEKKETVKEKYERIRAELGELNFEDEPEAYKKKAAELHKAGKPYFRELVKITTDRPRSKDDRYMIVNWGDRRFTIERGKEVEVPRGVANIIERSRKQAAAAEDYMFGLQDAYEQEAAKIR